MLVASGIIRTFIVAVLVVAGAILILSGSGVDMGLLMQGRAGASAVIATAAFLEGLLSHLRLASHELAVGIAMIVLALIVAFYRA